MLTSVHPKLPMRDKSMTKNYYINNLGFHELGTSDYPEYLMIEKDSVEIHFFLHKELVPQENYGQVYIRTTDVENFYQSMLDRRIDVHPNGSLQTKPWGQKEFSLLDPDNNCLTFGQRV